MKYLKTSLFLALCVACCTAGIAQVKFKLQQLNDGKTFQVSIVPETSYRPPLNITSTAQVTIKVPTTSFEVSNMINLQPNVAWEANSETASPEESKEFDYLSFGLATSGTDFLRYEIGIEVPIFTFENALPCTGEIALMDNATDPFMPPNSARKNVGNQITIAGANGDAYAGNMLKASIACGQLSTDVEELNKEETHFEMYPNPVSNELTISLFAQKAEEVELSVFDLVGQKVLTRNIDIRSGQNAIPLNISHLSQGAYLLELRSVNWKLNAGQFVKLEK